MASLAKGLQQMFVFLCKSWLWVFETEASEISDEEKHLCGLFLPSSSQWRHKFCSSLESFDEADSLQVPIISSKSHMKITW